MTQEAKASTFSSQEWREFLAACAGLPPPRVDPAFSARILRAGKIWPPEVRWPRVLKYGPKELRHSRQV